MNPTETTPQSTTYGIDYGIDHGDETDLTIDRPMMRRLGMRVQWCLLLGVGGLTILTGIGVLVALMSPENLQTAPTVALVCVLVLLCVPVPVLMLERSHRRSAASKRKSVDATRINPEPVVREGRLAVVHPSHQPHDSGFEAHRSVHTTSERKQTA